MYPTKFWSTLSSALLAYALCAGTTNAEEWKPAAGPLFTRWAKEVSPERTLPEYPRPQLTRERWTNLNGLWQYAVRPKDRKAPSDWDGEILVPFPIESALSGVMEPVRANQRLWYRRTFARPAGNDGERILLHFGAVDWEAAVIVNGKEVGVHRGGYTPFTFDITDALRDEGEQELVVGVWDPTSTSHQPRGKQLLNPQGIWYTPVTGIWQTVWLEPVPKSYIDRLIVTPTVHPDGSAILEVVVRANRDDEGLSARVEIVEAGRNEGRKQQLDGQAVGKAIAAKFERPDLWSPTNPVLHKLNVQLVRDGKVVDSVGSYFALRSIALRKDEFGRNRMFLNNEPLFQFGPLDQGWWPDGLYTAPTDAALAYDIEMTKRLGMNMCRKHVKVEPARWYYHCDRLGLLVWQDMPSGDGFIRGNAPDFERSAESEATFRGEWREIMDCTRHFPSVVVYVPFNEGWGQFKTNEILAWTKAHDPTRLVDGPSGWTDRGEGDMHDMHAYPGPSMNPISEKRASVLGEFGGLGLPLTGRLWQERDNWGYRTFESREELQAGYDALIHKLRPLIGRGLAAAVYTQTTDVEGEVNGLMTYDRAVIKLDVEKTAALHRGLYEPQTPLDVVRIVDTSESNAAKWRYTTTAPADGWTRADFDDGDWSEGEAGFGTENTPAAAARTPWTSAEIWMRRTVDVPKFDSEKLFLRVHHDEDAEVYVNGKLLAKLPGFTLAYEDIPLDAKAKALLRPGRNTIAVHCRQTRGGQYIDVGFVAIEEARSTRGKNTK